MSFISTARILTFLALCVSGVHSGLIPRATSTKTLGSSSCTPFHTTFSDASEIIPHKQSSVASSPFVAISEEGTYALGKDGLEMYLNRPDCKVTRNGSVNDIEGDGATINSTFTLSYGKVTFEMSAPTIAGVVSAAILIGSDEIDVELVGGDPTAWQTNIFAPQPEDKEPLWGVFGTIENLLNSSKLDDFHKYTVDWNADKIVWSVDGVVVRTLKKEDTRKNGFVHYPSGPARIQVGIWDASSPAGTSEWAHGPIDWASAPVKMTTYVKSITVECPDS